MRRNTRARRGKSAQPAASARPYVSSVDQMPSMPPWLISRYGYQRTPHTAAPKSSASARLGSAPFFFIVNPDCVLEPGALATLLETARADEDRVAAWEMRQIPYEHPKAYDPVTLETDWTSGAATLYRRRDFEAVGG